LDVIPPAIVLVQVETRKITRQMIHGAGVQVPDWRVIVVDGRCCVPGALVVVVVAL
jgi:hypothetical protein